MKKQKNVLLLLIICSVFLLFFTYNNDFLYKEEILRITSIDTLDTDVNFNNLGIEEKYYYNELTGVITNGNNKGKEKKIKYEETYSSVVTEKYKVGDKVFIEQNEIKGIKRDFYISIIVIIFVLSLYFVGNSRGLLSFINVCFNGLIFYLGLELYHNGLNLILLCLIEAIFFTIVSLLFATGKTKKTWCAITSTIVSLIILVGLLFIIKFTSFESINFNGLSFLTVPAESVFFSSLMIGGLGAIMDVSITMASSISELVEKDPSIKISELKKSGKEIGNDIMSTMINVLFFTYLSGELPILVLAFRNGFSLFNYISANFSLEITRFLIGAISIILTIPISNYTAIKFFKRGESKC